MSSKSGFTHVLPPCNRESAFKRRRWPGRPRMWASAPNPSVPMTSTATLPPSPGNHTSDVPWYGPEVGFSDVIQPAYEAASSFFCRLTRTWYVAL
ncbi:MAG: hypothetical protein R3B89_35585 [Polyangiaceae bacterium]